MRGYFIMELLSCFLFALSASLDALIVGITYGIRRVSFTFWQNLLISLITLTGTILSLELGCTLLPLLPPKATDVAGGAILMLLGAYYIIKYAVSTLGDVLSDNDLSTKEIKASSDSPPALQLRELLILGSALSVNNMGIGIGASIAGLSPLPTALFTLVLSVTFLSLGNCMGKLRILDGWECFADVLSGVLLMGLGLYELIF